MINQWLPAYLLLEVGLDTPILDALGVYYHWMLTRDYTKVPFPELLNFMWSIKLPHTGGNFSHGNDKSQAEIVKHLKGWRHINPAQLSMWKWEQIQYYYLWWTAVRVDWLVVHYAIVRRLASQLT